MAGNAPNRWVAGAVVLVVLYLVIAPLAWLARGWEPNPGGPLAVRAPPRVGSTALVGGARTADEVRAVAVEHGYDTGDDGEYTLRVVGDVLGERPVYAVYQLYSDSEFSVFDVGIFDGLTGNKLTGAGAVALAKQGGAWEHLGLVKSTQDLIFGGLGVASVLLLYYIYYRRERPRLGAATRSSASTWVRAAIFWLAFVLVAVVLVVYIGGRAVEYPDRLTTIVVLSQFAALAWGWVGGRVLMARADGDMRGGMRGDTRAVAGKEDANRHGSGADTADVADGGDTTVKWRSRDQPKQPEEPAVTDDPSRSSTVGQLAEEPAVATTTPPSRYLVNPPERLPNFSDVGGMDDVKRQLIETLGMLLAFPDEAADFRITFNGILLHGPPGAGKTFLAKAVAGEFGLSFVHVTAGDLVSKYVGETARNVEHAFRTAAANVPCMLFFDEFDAIAQDEQLNMEDRRSVAQLLVSLENHRTLRDLVVIAATSNLDSLDDGVTRPGRFDRHIRVDLPNADAREAILKACLEGRPVDPDLELSDVVRRTEGLTPAALASIAENASLKAFKESAASRRRVPISRETLLAAMEARGGTDRPTVEKWGWDRLVLPSEILDELRILQRILEDPEQARAFGVRPPTGMLLAGAPGTGKTTVARVLAAEARCSFYSVTAGDLLSKWVGESERAVSDLFGRARANAPSIVFIDEIDAIGRRRGVGASYEDRLLNQLLAEMDGLMGVGQVFVLAATNREDTLDPALIRGGRLTRILVVPMPDRGARRQLLTLHSAAMPLRDVDLDELAIEAEGLSGADIESLCQHAALAAMTVAAGEDDPGPAAVTRKDFEVALGALREARYSEGRDDGDAVQRRLPRWIIRRLGGD